MALNIGIQTTTVKRTGHARFRKSPTDSNAPSTSTQSAPPAFSRSTEQSTTYSTSTSSTSSSSSRSTNSEESVSNVKQFASLGVVAFSSRKPPLPSSHRKRCRSDRPTRSEHHSGCYCCKKRKITSKREIRRVPINGSDATIPADDYTWKKYGEKRSDGSPYPRVYYKCHTGKGCPARKRVEFTEDESKMLLITYAGEHVHAPLVLTSLTELLVQSK